jgi:hypothetical protein
MLKLKNEFIGFLSRSNTRNEIGIAVSFVTERERKLAYNDQICKLKTRQ